MTLAEILATPRKIFYVNNSGMDLTMFDKQIGEMIFSNSTKPPADLDDLIRVEYVQFGEESRCIIYAQ